MRKTLGTSSGPRSSYFMYQGDNISAEYTDNTGGWSSASAAYTQGAGTDQPFLRTEWSSAGAGANPSSRQFYHQDGLGSVIASTDQSGTNSASQRFDAWGNSIATSGTAISQYGYTGREPDATGLMYYRARYYSPDLGRFTQRDPIGLAGGVNMFGYVGGNPTSRTDPSGLYWFQQIWQEADPIVGRENTFVSPGGLISSIIEKYVPAGRTLGEIHDPLVDALRSAGIPDLIANIPTMPLAYISAIGLEILRSLGLVEQPKPLNVCPR